MKKTSPIAILNLPTSWSPNPVRSKSWTSDWRRSAGGANLTKDHSTLGTVAYMSPEQARGEIVDQRTDIWAFGVVLYEMLTGELPFRGHYEQAVIYSILNEEPDFSRIPAHFLPLVKRALEKKVEARYQNIEEMLADVRTLTGSKTLSGLGAKDGSSSRLQPAPKRKMLLLTGGLVVVVLTVAAMAYFFSKRGPAGLKIVSTRPLTSTPGFEGQPTWSPDGTRIAYISDESDRRDIWVRLLEYSTIVKLAVDIQRNILAGGGRMHADCESQLLADGSRQEDVWGANWIPASQIVEFEALINIRPKQQNLSMTIQDPTIKQQIETITKQLLEGV